jgi:hypothetical protein
MLMTFDKRTVIGMFKTAGNDPDLLYAQKELLLKGIKTAKVVAIVFFVFGGLLSLTGIGAIVGIPFIALGWLVRSKAVRNIATIEAAYADLSAGRAAQAGPMPAAEAAAP